MDWLREWIWQIAGIIILSAVCDMIMPGGEIKKYVRLVFGLVLVVTVIRPISDIPDLTIKQIDVYENRQNAAELKSRFTEKEQFNVIKLYKEKICENIRNELDTEIVDIKVEVEEKDEREFGTIKNVTVILYSDNEVENIRETIEREFGVKKENIRIMKLTRSAV